VRLHRDGASLSVAATFAKIADEFFARVELCAGWLVAIKIAYQTNAERNVVQIIAVYVAAVDLTPPAISHLDLAVASGSSVADHEVVSKTVLHPADMSMIIIKNARVSLPRPAVMHHNELPAAPLHRCASDSIDHRPGEITVVGWTTPRPETGSARGRRWGRLEALVFLDTRLFNDNLGALLSRNGP